MSLDRVIKSLVILGLSRIDAEVYVYTAKKGSQKLIDLKQSLNYSKLQITKSLKTLVTTGLMNKDGNLFSAIPFEEALELLIEQERHNALSIQKTEELTSWEKKD